MASGPACVPRGSVRALFGWGETRTAGSRTCYHGESNHVTGKEEQKRTRKRRRGREGLIRAHKETAPVLRISTPLPCIVFGIDPEQVSLRATGFLVARERRWTGEMDQDIEDAVSRECLGGDWFGPTLALHEPPCHGRGGLISGMHGSSKVFRRRRGRGKLGRGFWLWLPAPSPQLPASRDGGSVQPAEVAGLDQQQQASRIGKQASGQAARQHERAEREAVLLTRAISCGYRPR